MLFGFDGKVAEVGCAFKCNEWFRWDDFRDEVRRFDDMFMGIMDLLYVRHARMIGCNKSNTI